MNAECMPLCVFRFASEELGGEEREKCKTRPAPALVLFLWRGPCGADQLILFSSGHAIGCVRLYSVIF